MEEYIGGVQHLDSHYRVGLPVALRWPLQHVQWVPVPDQYSLASQVRLHLDQLIGLEGVAEVQVTSFTSYVYSTQEYSEL